MQEQLSDPGPGGTCVSGAWAAPLSNGKRPQVEEFGDDGTRYFQSDWSRKISAIRLSHSFVGVLIQTHSELPKSLQPKHTH